MGDLFRIPDFLQREESSAAGEVEERSVPMAGRVSRKVARRDRRALRALGYTEKQIAALGEKEAQFIILKGTEAPL